MTTLDLESGVSAAALDALAARHGEGAIPLAERRAALERYAQLPVRGDRPGRYWRHDLAKLDLSAFAAAGDRPTVAQFTLDETARAVGVVACTLAEAKSEHAELFAASFGRALDASDDKFASLALAFQSGGAFLAVPAGVSLESPIEIRYTAQAGAAIFPYSVVIAGEGARFTVVERIESDAEDVTFTCGATEILAGRSAHVDYGVVQNGGTKARTLMTRAARIAGDALVRIGFAELGSELAVSAFRATLAEAGASSETAALFFANLAQHVDLRTDVDHAVGNTTSATVVRSVGSQRGQGRYYGNIVIRPHAHGSEAALKDDALLLAPTAHVDSVPALEIAANDVRAFHGATIGAIDEEQIFYLVSRGITRIEAERLIALGFFDPVIMHFPTDTLREEIRSGLEAKILG